MTVAVLVGQIYDALKASVIDARSPFHDELRALPVIPIVDGDGEIWKITLERTGVHV